MKRLLAVLMMFLLTGVSKADVFNMGDGLTSLEFVTVGNPGNAADSTGYGAVDHVYQIGKFEVTAGQYTEFLNAVAATDTYGLYSTLMWSRRTTAAGSNDMGRVAVTRTRLRPTGRTGR